MLKVTVPKFTDADAARVVREVELEVQEALRRTMILAHEISRARLRKYLGEEKFKHFNVVVSMSADSPGIGIEPLTEVGRMIYHGTRPRSVSSGTPMPIGNGKFARSVRHPGTTAHGERMDEIVRRSVAEALILGGMIR